MNTSPKTVLSLFDGMGCGRVALEMANIPVKQYYASEIDRFAISVARANYPDITHLGDVTKWKDWGIDFSKIDMLIGGSPCQGFSFAGKQLNFNDERSKLFFVYLDILNAIKKVNPNVVFLLENVVMKDEHEAVITKFLGCEPALIDFKCIVGTRKTKTLLEQHSY